MPHDIRTEAFCDIILPLFQNVVLHYNVPTRHKSFLTAYHKRLVLKKAMHDAAFFLENSCSHRISIKDMTEIEKFLYGDEEQSYLDEEDYDRAHGVY